MGPSSVTIRANSLKRLLKDLKGYETELDDHLASLERLEASGADEYEIKSVTRLIEESSRIVPAVRNRVESSIPPLEKVLDSATTEERPFAENILKEARAAITGAYRRPNDD